MVWKREILCQPWSSEYCVFEGGQCNEDYDVNDDDNDCYDDDDDDCYDVDEYEYDNEMIWLRTVFQGDQSALLQQQSIRLVTCHAENHVDHDNEGNIYGNEDHNGHGDDLGHHVHPTHHGHQYHPVDMLACKLCCLP